MKTMEQFLNEIKANKELAEKLKKVTNDAELEAFLKGNGVEGTAEDFKKLVAVKAKESGALSDEQLEAVSGGVISWLGQKFYEWLDSLF
ncbi:MAG: Nif11-like leader peptide family RiPP precursor [Oscillospiraceae bacterium]